MTAFPMAGFWVWANAPWYDQLVSRVTGGDAVLTDRPVMNANHMSILRFQQNENHGGTRFDIPDETLKPQEAPTEAIDELGGCHDADETPYRLRVRIGKFERSDSPIRR